MRNINIIYIQLFSMVAVALLLPMPHRSHLAKNRQYQKHSDLEIGTTYDQYNNLGAS